VVARRLYELLTPIFERLFLDNSFGFRPGRNTWQALAALEAAMRLYGAWVITPEDITGAFDHANIERILSHFARVINDRQYLALIAAVLHGSEGLNRKEGIEIGQGDPLSPLALNVHLHYAHDVPIDAEGTPPFWLRYADDLAYLTREVSEGRKVRERSADLLRQVGLTLKGPGTPTDLRDGGSVTLLGLTLSLRNDTIRYEIPDEAYTELEISLEQAHQSDDPPETARRAVYGWVGANGPAFESSADSTVPRILKLITRFGFRGCTCSKDIRTLWESAHQQWLTARGDALRKVTPLCR